MFMGRSRAFKKFGTFLRNVPLLSLVDRENQQVRLDSVKFTWLGSAATGAGDAYVLVVRADVPIQSLEQIRGADKPTLIMGATAPGTQLYDLPAMLSRTLGLNIKMVAGYNGSQALSLAVMRKEIDGRVSSLSVLRSTLPEWLDQRLVRVLLQMGRATRHPDFPDVPLSRELATNADDRALIELMDFPQIMATPYVAPPGIPAETTAILQKAFAETFHDPDYVAEGKGRKMEMSPIDGPGLQALLTDMSRKLTPQLVSRYQDIVAKIKTEAK
jgi:tripartite-type tricarboxylate transporter receptor subunit TctC